jgi:hypothetical protein
LTGWGSFPQSVVLWSIVADIGCDDGSGNVISSTPIAPPPAFSGSRRHCGWSCAASLLKFAFCATDCRDCDGGCGDRGGAGGAGSEEWWVPSSVNEVGSDADTAMGAADIRAIPGSGPSEWLGLRSVVGWEKRAEIRRTDNLPAVIQRKKRVLSYIDFENRRSEKETVFAPPPNERRWRARRRVWKDCVDCHD